MNAVSVVDPVDGYIYMSEEMDEFEYNVCKNDEHYKRQLLELGRSSRQNVILIEKPAEIKSISGELHPVEKESGAEFAGNTTQKEHWTAEATKLLLASYEEFSPQVGKVFALKTKKIMWKRIADKMKAKGHNFSSMQVENRWKTLDRGYKQKVLHNKSTGRNRASCAFEKELEDINKKRKAIFPEFLIGREKEGKSCSTLQKEAGLTVEEDDHIDADTENIPESPCSSASLAIVNSSPRPRFSGNKSRTILAEIQDLKDQKDEQFNKKMLLQERKLKIEEAKLEAFNRRTDAIIEKNALLKQILEKKDS